MRDYAVIRMRGGHRGAKQVDQECAKGYLQGRSLGCSGCMIRDTVQAARMFPSGCAAIAAENTRLAGKIAIRSYVIVAALARE